MSGSEKSTRRLFSYRVRNTLLTIHIAVSVGLLGDCAGLLAIAVRASRMGDPAAANETLRVLNMLAKTFGIPLSFATLISGVTLGLGTKWGILQYPWVIAKLLLTLAVILTGALVFGPALRPILAGAAGPTQPLIAAAAFDLVALATATGLSVFKSGRRLR